MVKNCFVLTNLERILDSLTRGLPLEILAEGRGFESRGVPVSYQALTPVLGLVLPSNSPGVHTLWLAHHSAADRAGVQARTARAVDAVPHDRGLLPGRHPARGDLDLPGVGRHRRRGARAAPRASSSVAPRPSSATRATPRCRCGPGFSKILLGDDVVDDWERYLDIMALSVLANSGRGCINCSGIWASRHTEEIAQALAEQFAQGAHCRRAARCGPRGVHRAERGQGDLAADRQPAGAGRDHRRHRQGARGGRRRRRRHHDRLIERQRCDYLRPTVIHAPAPDAPLANAEYMFPFVSVAFARRTCLLQSIGQTLVASAITADQFTRQLVDATNIDRLNIGAIPTIQLDLAAAPRGNIIEFLFRHRAFQASETSVSAT